MISGNDIRNGISIVVDNVLYQVVEAQHVKPGKGGAFVRAKLRNMRTKNVLEKTFRAEEKVESAFIETKRFHYTYHSGHAYVFMDDETFEEIHISEEVIGDKKDFLKGGLEVTASFHGQNIIEINLPFFVNFRVINTEPAIKGDTAKATNKPAKIETGAIVQAPLFINEGDTIKVDTRTGEYIERV